MRGGKAPTTTCLLVAFESSLRADFEPSSRSTRNLRRVIAILFERGH